MGTLSIVGARLGLALLVAGGAAIALPGAAAAAQPAESGVSRAAHSTVRFDRSTGTTVAAEYRQARTDPARGGAEKKAFLAKAAAGGRYYDAGAVDYLRFVHDNGELAEVVSPRDYRIDHVEISAGPKRDPSGREHYSVGATASGTDLSGAPLAYPAGPGFDTFSYVDDGVYTLSTSRGWLEFHWVKYKDKQETNSTRDLWGYKRWAVATPRDITGINDAVETMGMRSYPSSGSKANLLGWIALSPLPGDYDGDCGSGLSVQVANIGTTFTPCESYEIDWNPAADQAGDMSFNWENSYWPPTTGVQSMAAVFTVKSKQNTQPYYNDYVYVNFMILTGMHTAGCGSTNANKNC